MSSIEKMHEQRILEEFNKNCERNLSRDGFVITESPSITVAKEISMDIQTTTIKSTAQTKEDAIKAITKNVDKIFPGFLNREMCCRNGYDILQSLYDEKTSIKSISFRGFGIYGCSKHHDHVADKVNAYTLKVKNNNNEYQVSLIRNDRFTFEY